MNPVFLDTVGLLALWDFVTTTFVLLECGNTAARRPYRTKVAVLRRTLEAGQRMDRDG